MSREGESEYQAELKTQIGVLEAWIEGCTDKTTARFRAKVRRRQELLNELRLSEQRQAGSHPRQARALTDSFKRSVNAKDEKAPRSVGSSQPWYESSPDIVRRRQIILKNPGLPSKSFCKVFDNYRIPLPGVWEQRFGVASWGEAYENKQARALIQKLISTDKKKS